MEKTEKGVRVMVKGHPKTDLPAVPCNGREVLPMGAAGRSSRLWAVLRA
jgi:hypothetical protein